MGEFRMPSLGADMEAGTLLLWKVEPGDRVKRGDIIAEVETDKGDIEVEVFEDGVVQKLLVEPGTKVPVGTPLATIGAEGEPGREAAAVPVAREARPEKPRPARAPRAPAAVAAVAGEGRLRISPAARKRAGELGVDPASLKGTGPGGAISLQDVERAALSAEGAAPAPAAGFPQGMRRAIASAMARSNREIPHYYLMTRIEMSRALRWLESENQKRPVKERLLPVVLLIKAVARALQDVPELNGYWLEDRLQPREAIHIGFAISLRQGGLVVPAIHEVDAKSLDELMETLRDLIPRARAGRLRSSELTDATITLTSLGDLGVETVYGVIYPPQVALVGFGKITEEPWAENGLLGVRPVLTATLAADHRATDGHRGGQFLEALNLSLQEPERL